jgi:cellulose synthase/poly-beta-1,6-N-acetylglucosamine synthase-like glycosyltransferase
MDTSISFLVIWVMVRLISILSIMILLVFTLRRILFALTILFTRKTANDIGPARKNLDAWPDVLIVTPCRDEETMIAHLGRALSRLDYPDDKRRVVFIDDGSSDNTRWLMEQCARDKSGWNVLSLPTNVGKARALNTALAQFSCGEIIYVLDADHRPEPSTLKSIIRYFDNPQIAGVSGRTLPSNPLASPSAYYSTVETFIHQMLTMRAKERLGLAPAMLGSNCAYRRELLAECGGFRDGALLEDSDLTLAFYRAGYQVRFAEDSVTYHQVPESVNGYLRQHTRWARGFADVVLTHTAGLMRDGRLPLPLRAELFLFATGYLDRIALICAAVLAVLSILYGDLFEFPVWILCFALLTPMFQILALFVEQRVSRAMWLRLPLIPIFYTLDIFAATRALVDFPLGRARVWMKTLRSESIHDLM